MCYDVFKASEAARQIHALSVPDDSTERMKHMKIIMRIVSVLLLLLGIALLVAGAMNIGVVLEMGAPKILTDILIALAVILIIVNGVFEILGGILGLRAAGRAGGSTAAVVFGVLSLAISVVSVVIKYSVSALCACILPLIYLLCAFALRLSRSKQS